MHNYSASCSIVDAALFDIKKLKFKAKDQFVSKVFIPFSNSPNSLIWPFVILYIEFIQLVVGFIKMTHHISPLSFYSWNSIYNKRVKEPEMNIIDEFNSPRYW